MSGQHAHTRDAVSFKSLDSESIGAARAAARASGMSLEDWLSRTILESVRAQGADGPGDTMPAVADQPGWTGREDPGQTIDAITRHLMEAQAAADKAGVSVAEWLSRTILENAQEEAAANSNVPPADTDTARPEPDDEPETGTSQEDRLARIIASRRAELEAEEREKQPDLLADLEMPERPMTLTKNMQMPHNLPRFGDEGRRRVPWLWLAIVLLMVAVAAIIWVVPNLPGPGGKNAGETTVSVDGKGPGRTDTAGGGKGGETRTDGTAPGRDGSNGTTVKLPNTVTGGGATGDRKSSDAKSGGKPGGTTADNGASGTGKRGETGNGTAPRADAKPPATGNGGRGTDGKAATPPTAPKSNLPPLTETNAAKLPKPIGTELAWYRKASDAGNVAAQFALGSHFIRQKDMKAAAVYMRKAADQGHAEAQYTLGALYAYGLGLPKSDVDAVLMYQKAADQGYVPAITEVGLAYLHGRGVERDLRKAFTYLERAAEANEPNAQYTLGRLYESGIGVKKDLVTAFKWFILAAENKHQLAASRVEDLSIDLSRDQRERGAELVREHKQRFPKKES